MDAQMETSHYVQLLIQISSIAVLYYDYSLTLITEIQHIWRRKFVGVSVLYFGCRLSLLANTLYLVGLLKALNMQIVSLACGVLGVLVRECVLGTWILRGWVIWDRNVWILIVFVPWSLGTVLLDVLMTTPVSSHRIDVGLTLLYFLLEFSITAISIIRLVLQTNRHREARFFKLSLIQRLIHEGILYIVAMTVINLASIIIAAILPLNTFYNHMFTAYNLPLSGLLTARIILDIRFFDSEPHTNSTLDKQSAIRFQDMHVRE